MTVLAILSPAKSLRFGPALGHEAGLPASEPRLLPKSAALARAMRAYDGPGLAALMDVSAALGELNRERFARVDQPLAESDPECRRALFCFDGDAYGALRPETLDAPALARVGQRLRIVSGYYGLLRPADLMRAYRLEMGRKPSGIGAKSLLAFWGADIASLLASDAESVGAGEILSLASLEYAEAFAGAWKSKLPLHEARFETLSASGRKVISFDAKRGRGLLARHACESDARSVQEAAETFRRDGWSLSARSAARADGSSLWTFVRPKGA